MGVPAIFTGLDPAVAGAILAAAAQRSFAGGEVVFREGEAGESMMIVTRGRLACRLTTMEGEECMFRLYSPGEVFGRVAVAPLEAVRSMTIVALEDSKTLELSGAQVQELRAEHLVVNDALLGLAGLELRRLSERIVELMFVDADRRVRRRLLELGEQYRDPQSGAAVIGLTQEEIGQLAGTSRMTVSRVLSQEQRRGTISKQRRTITVLDSDGLAQAAAWPDRTIPPALR